MSATNSVEQHIYYEKEKAPEKIQSYARTTASRDAQLEQMKDLWRGKQLDMTEGVPRIAHIKAKEKSL